MLRYFAFFLLLLLGLPAPHLVAQEESDAPPPDVEGFTELESTRQGEVTIAGEKVRYEAKVGDLLLRSDVDGEASEPMARFTFVSYERTGVEDRHLRPVTFAFNGGPGSASVWVHLGAFGPKRALLDDEGFPNTPPPGKLVDNEYSLLDATDLVFIDPVSTGFSRSAPGEDASQFHGYTNDVASIGEFIRHWVTRNGRWASPKFLAGESYGTTRAAGLAEYLQGRHGMYLNGICLISSVINWQTKVFNVGNDLPHLLILPTMTAAAWYHGKLPERFETLEAALAESEEFVLGDYATALMQGDRLPIKERQRIRSRIAELTGLSEAYVGQTDLRPEIFRFTKELLRSEAKTVGRLDARFTGRDLDSAGERFEYDPSSAVTTGWFVSLMNDYLRRDLGYPRELPFRASAGAAVRPWNYHETGRTRGYGTNAYANYAETLRSAMSRNPYLKVLVMSGYYDFATPYFATDYTVDHMQLAPELRKNIVVEYYEAGHMMYIRLADLAKFREDYLELIRSAQER